MAAKTKPELGFNIDNGRGVTASEISTNESAKIQFSARIDADMYRQLKMLAISRNTKIQVLIEQAIEDFLANNK